ncbi:MAG: dienelactone hydrolase family protein [Chloroflexi bacterium]|nr:dienelactone hydrolase family protein [Chloroflexota bacterium]
MTTETAKRRQELYDLLGELPDRQRPITAQTISTEQGSAYSIERLVLNLNGLEPVPAYFLRPLAAAHALPVILYNHAHGSNYTLGKQELIEGSRALQNPPYADALTAAGYAVLCIDHWAFGERRGRAESEIFKLMLWHGQVMWGMMVYDSLRAIDYLCSRPDVDAERIGTLGLSMGSTMAWWTAALDERVRVCVDICCLTDYQALIAARRLDEHGVYYYVPGLLKRFTTAQINALIAPRPHLSLAGEYDPLTPPDGLRRINTELRQVYTEAGAPEAWSLLTSPTGHYETAAMRAEVMRFLAKWL